MANSTQRVRGLIESLSDFWLLYFRDIDQLKVLYEGADTLMGNVYLELLSSLLNASLLDAPLFNKEYYKLVSIRETELSFLRRTSADASRYVYTAEDNVVSVQALQNRIFAVTAALEKDVDFYVTKARTFEFRFDPLNAYLRAEFGAHDSVVRVRSRDPHVRQMQLVFTDSGTTPPHIAVSADGTRVHVDYDGPEHDGTATARVLVSALNAHHRAGAVLQAELLKADGGGFSPRSPGTLPLVRQAVSPLDGYGVRHVEQAFGGRFTAPRLGSFVGHGIEKGDVLRLIAGTPHEYVIRTVRDDGLYVLPGEALTDIAPASRMDFSILRQPEDNEVLREPIGSSGQLVLGGDDAVIDPMARTLTSAVAAFSVLHKDDVIELQGLQNIGPVRILDVLDAHTVTLAATGLVAEQAVTWSLFSALDPASIGQDGTYEGRRFTTPRDVFTPQVIGTYIRLESGHVAIEAFVSPKEVRLAEELVAAQSGLRWGWANYIAPPTRVAFPYIVPDTLRVSGRSLRGNTVLIEGRDYLVHADKAQIQPLSVWRTDRDLRIDYKYRHVVLSGSQPLMRGQAGTLVSGIFQDEYAAFGYYDVGQAIDVLNIGTFYIDEVRSATEVRLTPDSRLLGYTDPNARFLWQLLPRGTLDTKDVRAFVQEISFWALDALVDKFNLHQTYEYLINRFEVSSEAYRALIRGVFQLFMLGPTLERMESAINVVAGLPVIRQDGEILLAYHRGATQQGADGVLSASSGIFSADSAHFSDEDISSFIYIEDGLAENRLYKITARLSATEVRIEGLTTDDRDVRWELTRFAEHRITTTRQSYTLPRTIPLRSALTDGSAQGTKIFRAFEVLTEAFTVTDSIENPTWWERIQIPEQLWPGASATRRQSTPALVEHVIKPYDDARIGDPGYRIGSDHTGFVPEPGTLPMRHHVAFVILDNGLKQHLFYVSFNPVLFDRLSPALIQDLQEFVFVARPAYTYIVLSPSSIFKERVRIEEQLVRAMRMRVAGDGEHIVAYAPVLRVGDGWNIGSWFRSTYSSGAFVLPAGDAGSVPVLATNPGRTGFITALVTDSVPPLPRVRRIFRAVGAMRTGTVQGEDLLTDEPVFTDPDLSTQLRVNGTEVTIGQVAGPTQVSLGGIMLPEGPASWQRGNYGSERGQLRAEAGSTTQARFTDLTRTHAFEAGDVGTFIHFLLSDARGNQGVQIAGLVAADPFSCVVTLVAPLQDKSGPWEHVRDVVRPDGSNLVFDLRDVHDRPEVAEYVVHGFEEPLDVAAGGFSAVEGDTRYFIGMHAPHPARFRSRTGLDADLFEYPLKIKRRPVNP